MNASGAGLLHFVTRHPVRGAILFWILFFLISTLAGFIVLIVRLPVLGLVGFSEAVLGIAGIGLLSMFGWWRRAGYLSIGGRRDLVLYLLPFAIALLLLTGGIPATPAVMVIEFAAVSAVVGFAEETFFRGLILQSLIPAGALRAVLVSAALFALPHLANAIGGLWDPIFTIADTIAAFGIGVTFAALLIRTGTIWPLIGLHALIDFTSLLATGTLVVPAQSSVDIAITAGTGVLLTAYGLVLLRIGKGRVPDMPGTNPDRRLLH